MAGGLQRGGARLRFGFVQWTRKSCIGDSSWNNHRALVVEISGYLLTCCGRVAIIHSPWPVVIDHEHIHKSR